jgi:hypothetical protein
VMYRSVNFSVVVNEYHIDTAQPDSSWVVSFGLSFLSLLGGGGGWKFFVSCIGTWLHGVKFILQASVGLHSFQFVMVKLNYLAAKSLGVWTMCLALNSYEKTSDSFITQV